MIQTKEAVIDGKKFRVTQLGYSEGVELLTKILSFAGAGFAEGQQDKFSISKLAAKLNSSDLKMVVEKLADKTIIERESGSDKWPKLDPELDFSGEYGLLFKWLKFALEVNFGGFFYALGSLNATQNVTAVQPL